MCPSTVNLRSSALELVEQISFPLSSTATVLSCATCDLAGFAPANSELCEGRLFSCTCCSRARKQILKPNDGIRKGIPPDSYKWVRVSRVCCRWTVARMARCVSSAQTVLEKRVTRGHQLLAHPKLGTLIDTIPLPVTKGQ